MESGSFGIIFLPFVDRPFLVHFQLNQKTAAYLPFVKIRSIFLHHIIYLNGRLHPNQT